MTDIFELQEQISRLVASRIETELGLAEQKKAEQQPRKNLGAWDIYQLGLAEFYKFTIEGNRKSLELLRKAIELEPHDLAAGISLVSLLIDSGNPAEALFGLGASAEVERLRVRWPDGSESVGGRRYGQRLRVVDADSVFDDGAD